MTSSPFEPVEASLRRELVEYYRESGERLTVGSWHVTLETNSVLVERRAEPLLEMLCRELDRPTLRGLRVIDLGCGFGALAVYFASHGASVRGIDPNGRRIVVGQRVAAFHGLDVQLGVGRMEGIESDDARFDLAIQNNSLCYVVDPRDRIRALMEARRVLRPGGLLLIRNPNRLAPVDQFTGLPLLHLLPPGGAQRTARLLRRNRSNVRLLSNHGAVAEVRRAGFERVRAVSSPASSWPGWLQRFARYQHVMAMRPAQAPTPRPAADTAPPAASAPRPR
jgi:2-polyprenyl-3-methyl-5-hydroxy-6-metoxy-1,4-benzoquinol methylase